MSLVHKNDICLNCRHFNNSPEYLESVYKGWKVLGSAYGSVCKDDGICDKLDEYLSAYDWCDGFEQADGSPVTA
ncbi:hypothetical protein dsx2_2882 [Desulfovibrio sp. X2]|uniref:hypothetical protein n=1 Tax=Desulfovibrio sp. X2 TaxID=941449 RepID=UPI000358AE04|nr:hypothetical protein [Desulfovibrio sp. X2]EPR42095.1 hypothetical protein dsx2_2882 [Desulfovibrio sp. X2]